mmetsp:Transcript_51231/g.153914  ORF Transcript_51231/g.153914 Transcript_51231/m.153914 type:complete len:207 (-) Transcript_51231:2431-3051(-)
MMRSFSIFSGSTLVSVVSEVSASALGNTYTSLSPFSNLSAVMRSSSIASRLEVAMTPVLLSHTFRTMRVLSSTTSAFVKVDGSKAVLDDTESWSCIKVSKFRVVSTVFSSSSFIRTTGLVRKIPKGSTMVPKTERPDDNVPDASRSCVHRERLPDEMILASCSMKIFCRGVSSSDAMRSRISSARISTSSARDLSSPRSSPEAEVL